MRRIVTALLSTITALVLLFSYHTSTDSGSPLDRRRLGRRHGAGSTPEGSDHPDPLRHAVRPVRERPGRGRRRAAGDDGGAAAAPAPTATASPTPKAQSSATKTYTGDAVDTRWGPVQVQITVTGGKITAAQAVQYPNGNGRDAEINGYAAAGAEPGGGAEAERPDRHGLRRHRHQRRLPPVAAVGPRPGAPVSRRAPGSSR